MTVFGVVLLDICIVAACKPLHGVVNDAWWNDDNIQMSLLPRRIRIDDSSFVFSATKLCQLPSLPPNNVQLEFPSRALLHTDKSRWGQPPLHANGRDKQTTATRALRFDRLAATPL